MNVPAASLGLILSMIFATAHVTACSSEDDAAEPTSATGFEDGELAELQKQCQGEDPCILVQATQICEEECGKQVAASLGKALGVTAGAGSATSDPWKSTPAKWAGCVGVRTDLGGTEKVAEALIRHLGKGYWRGKCQFAGWQYSVFANTSP